MRLPRSVIAGLAVLGVAAALSLTSTAASAATLLRPGATGADSASVDTPWVTWKPSAKVQRVRVEVTASQIIAPYTYDDSYNKVYGPQQVVPVTDDGTIRVECIKLGPRWKTWGWLSSSELSRSILTNTITTFRIPLRNAARCRVSLSLSVSEYPIRADAISTTISGTVMSVK